MLLKLLPIIIKEAEAGINSNFNEFNILKWVKWPNVCWGNENICLILISRGQLALQSQGFLFVIMNSTPQPICTHELHTTSNYLYTI